MLAHKLAAIIDLMTKAGYEVTVHPTQAVFDAAHAAAAAAESGLYDYVFCSGGDGTLNEVLCGMLHTKHQVPIGYIPCGSTNDFARSIGIPNGLMKAAKAVLDGVPRKIDIGMVNDRSFNYIAAFGAFTDVTYETSQSAKNVLGPAAYLLNSLPKLTNIRTFPMRITCDDLVLEDDFAYGMITNTSSVGGILNVQDVHFDDGLFEVTLLKKPAKLSELQKVLTFLGDIRQTSEDQQIYCLRASHITMELLQEMDVPWTVDGEYMQSAGKMQFVNHKQAITLLVPKGANHACFQEDLCSPEGNA